MKTDLKNTKEIKSYLKSRFQDLDIDLEIDEKSKVISGKVLFPHESIYLSRVFPNFIIKTESKISNRNTWYAKTKNWTDIYKFPKETRNLPNGKNNLNSQAKPQEILKLWGEKNQNELNLKKGFLLAEAKDGAIGWIKSDGIEKVTPKDLLQKSSHQKLSRKNKDELESELMDLVLKFSDIPYLLGGKGDGGMDCSAFTQELYKEIFGVDLPRSAAMQRDFLTKTDKPKFLDLIFAKHKNGWDHIGASLENNKVLHLCREINKPAIESLEKFKRRYNNILFLSNK